MAKWTQTEREDIARRFRVEGQTATEISRAYEKTHPQVTRNAILGVLHRAGELGKGRSSVQSQPSSRQRARLNAPRPVLALAPPPAEDEAVTYVAPEVIEATATTQFGRSPGQRRDGQGIPIRPAGPSAAPILQLGSGQCRFPVGEPTGTAERLFCGLPSAGAPYCPKCRKLAYAPEAPRTSARDLLRLAVRAS